jgi:hypothetical protein
LEAAGPLENLSKVLAVIENTVSRPTVSELIAGFNGDISITLSSELPVGRRLEISAVKIQVGLLDGSSVRLTALLSTEHGRLTCAPSVEGDRRTTGTRDLSFRNHPVTIQVEHIETPDGASNFGIMQEFPTGAVHVQASVTGRIVDSAC